MNKLRLLIEFFFRSFRGCIVFSITYASPFFVYAQVPPQVIPPSPDAAAFGKYGEVPVSNYTGVPNINIPLYEIKTGKVLLPISLSYHAGGIKVEDISSNVGLGWTLNSGGVITRSIMGLPDDLTDVGFFNNVLSADMSNSDSYMKQVAGPPNQLDAQPDVYYFNFGKYSGQLIFSKSGNCYSIPHHNFKIKPGVGPRNQGSSLWEVTTEEGIKYTFGQTEGSEITTVCENGGGIPSQQDQIPQFTSSWYLTKVEDMHSLNFVSLTYFAVPVVSYDIRSSYEHTMTFDEEYGCGGSSLNCIGNYGSGCTTFTKIKYLAGISQITFPGGLIDFGRSGRLDLPSAFRITGLTIKNYKGDLLKSYNFSNDQYFESGCGTTLCKRLKLSSVREVGRDGIEKSPHSFLYHGEALPPRDSKDTDYWGYYNKRGNTDDFPEFIDYFNEESHYDYLPGANRRSNSETVKAGTLSKIVYPTGGYSEFEYEVNDVVSNRLPNRTSSKVNLSISGPPNSESSTFTIAGYFQPGLYVKVTYKTIGCSTSSIPSLEDNCPIVKVVGVSGTSGEHVFQSGTLEETVFFLPNGQYRLKGMNAGSGQSFTLSIEYEPEINSPNKFAGGLRVFKITDSDDGGVGSKIIRKFIYNDDTGTTTGRNGTYPKYFYFKTNWRNDPTSTLPNEVRTPLFVRTTDSNTTLATTHGSYVGYGKVTELRGEFGEYGKTEYFYTSVWKSETDGTSTYLDTYLAVPPFGPPMQDNDSKRGYLIRQVDYKYISSSSWTPIKEILNDYKSLGTGVEIRGIKAAIIENHENKPNLNVYSSSLIRRYGNLGYIPNYSIERTFNENGTIETTRDFTYSSTHRELLEEVVTLREDIVTPANSWKIKTKYKYPTDYSTGITTDSYSLGIKAMGSRNIQNTIVEKQVWELKNGETRLIDAEINLYYPNGYDLEKKFKLKSIASVNEVDYTPSYIDVSGNFTFQTTNFQDLIQFNSYDSETGNLLEYTISDGVTKKAYIWGYNKLYPIAEFTNARYSSVFHTSFEDLGEGNSAIGDANTGLSSSTTGYTKTIDNLIPGQYILSYKSKVSGSWQPPQTQSITVTTSSYSINLTGQVDDIVFYPLGAQFTIYSFDPGIGLISTTDNNYQRSFYEYDGLGRLSLVRDNNRSIVKTYDYNYKIK